MTRVERFILNQLGGNVVAYRCEEHGLFIQNINDKPQGCPICYKMSEQIIIEQDENKSKETNQT